MKDYQIKVGDLVSYIKQNVDGNVDSDIGIGKVTSVNNDILTVVDDVTKEKIEITVDEVMEVYKRVDELTENELESYKDRLVREILKETNNEDVANLIADEIISSETDEDIELDEEDFYQTMRTEPWD